MFFRNPRKLTVKGRTVNLLTIEKLTEVSFDRATSIPYPLIHHLWLQPWDKHTLGLYWLLSPFCSKTLYYWMLEVVNQTLLPKGFLSAPRRSIVPWWETVTKRDLFLHPYIIGLPSQGNLESRDGVSLVLY